MFHLDCVLELLVEVVASLKGGIEVVVHPIWGGYSMINRLELGCMRTKSVLKVLLRDLIDMLRKVLND